MKKLLLFVLLFISVVANAQKGISYQAVILDPAKIEIPGQDIAGQPLVNGNVSVKFVILSGTTSQFEEVQQTKTDAYGLVNLTIGAVANSAFNAITWDAVQKSLQVYVSFNNGASYTKVSDQKLTYTPYALFAETAGKLGSTLEIANGGTGATTAVGARANLGLGNVDNTADASKPISAATQTALNLKANATDLALKAPLASPTFTGTVSGVTKSMVGLGDVDNTADATKPISTATQAALNLKADAADLALKAPLASPTFTGTVSGITKTMVGLGSVDNTTDAAKPISTATQAALDLKANTADVNIITNAIALKVDQSSLAAVATSGSFNDLTNKPTGYVTSVGSISGSSNSNGAVITSGVLSLTPADASNGGIVTNGTQTIAGNKTFNGNIAFANNINVKGIGLGLGAGSQSTFFGYSSTANGNNSTAIGFMSQNGNSGVNNTSLGSNTLRNTGTGSYNTAVGSESGQVIASYNTFIGAGTNGAASVSNSTALGYGAYLTESNTIQLGANGFNGTTPITKVKTSGTLIAGTVTYPNAHNSTNGQVLTVNAAGTASWVTPTTVTVGTISTTSNSNGATITAGGVLNLAPADASNGGIVTTGTQTFGGDKEIIGSLKLSPFGSETLDQSSTSPYAGTGAYSSVWQSFTAGASGLLSKVSMDFYNCQASGTLYIYQGTGTNGTVLTSQPFSISTIGAEIFANFTLINPVDVQSGSVYTIAFVASTGTLWEGMGGPNSYTSGVAYFGNTPSSNSNTSWSILFKTYVKQFSGGGILTIGKLTGGNTTTSTISGFAANMNTQTGTSYTLQASDNGKIITLNNASAITLTVPALFTGFNCMIVQLGAGQVTLTASGTTISNRSSFTKTAGTNAIATLIGLSGTSFISAGDMQ